MRTTPLSRGSSPVRGASGAFSSRPPGADAVKHGSTEEVPVEAALHPDPDLALVRQDIPWGSCRYGAALEGFPPYVPDDATITEVTVRWPEPESAPSGADTPSGDTGAQRVMPRVTGAESTEQGDIAVIRAKATEYKSNRGPRQRLRMQVA